MDRGLEFYLFVNDNWLMYTFCPLVQRHLKRCLPTRTDMVWLQLIVLLCNALLPAASASTLFGEQNKVLMCTTSGYQWRDINNGTAQTSERPHCQQCINTDHDEGPALLASKTRSFQRADRNFSAVAQTTFLAVFSSTHQARAPPSSF